MGNTSPSQPRPQLLLSSRPWNAVLAERLHQRLHRPVHVIDVPAHCTPEAVGAIDPESIFVPHWSHWIPESIWGLWPTVIFHMTDLPYGRGGTMRTALPCGAGPDRFKAFRGTERPAALVGCR